MNSTDMLIGGAVLLSLVAFTKKPQAIQTASPTSPLLEKPLLGAEAVRSVFPNASQGTVRTVAQYNTLRFNEMIKGVSDKVHHFFITSGLTSLDEEIQRLTKSYKGYRDSGYINKANQIKMQLEDLKASTAAKRKELLLGFEKLKEQQRALYSLRALSIKNKLPGQDNVLWSQAGITW